MLVYILNICIFIILWIYISISLLGQLPNTWTLLLTVLTQHGHCCQSWQFKVMHVEIAHTDNYWSRTWVLHKSVTQEEKIPLQKYLEYTFWKDNCSKYAKCFKFEMFQDQPISFQLGKKNQLQKALFRLHRSILSLK